MMGAYAVPSLVRVVGGVVVDTGGPRGRLRLQRQLPGWEDRRGSGLGDGLREQGYPLEPHMVRREIRHRQRRHLPQRLRPDQLAGGGVRGCH
jgi:hypothetical protein